MDEMKMGEASGRVQIVCPDCGFRKELPQHAIPPNATTATCPRCACRFSISQTMAAAGVDLRRAEHRSTVQSALAGVGHVHTETKEELEDSPKPRRRANRSLRPGLFILVSVIIIVGAGFILFRGARGAHSTKDQSGHDLGKTVAVQPKGVFAQIDTRRTREMLQQLSSRDHQVASRAMAKIISAPGTIQPPVFFALATFLYTEGKVEDAIFWLNAGRVRARFDANRCADMSARQAASILSMQMPKDLLKEQFKDLDRLRALITRAVEWDRVTPHDYDHRWINLHGMGAVISGLEEERKAGKQAELSLPEEQWPELAEQTREKYLREADEFIAKMRTDIGTTESQSRAQKRMDENLDAPQRPDGSHRLGK